MLYWDLPVRHLFEFTGERHGRGAGERDDSGTGDGAQS